MDPRYNRRRKGHHKPASVNPNPNERARVHTHNQKQQQTLDPGHGRAQVPTGTGGDEKKTTAVLLVPYSVGSTLQKQVQKAEDDYTQAGEVTGQDQGD